MNEYYLILIIIIFLSEFIYISYQAIKEINLKIKKFNFVLK